MISYLQLFLDKIDTHSRSNSRTGIADSEAGHLRDIRVLFDDNCLHRLQFDDRRITVTQDFFVFRYFLTRCRIELLDDLFKAAGNL